LQIPRLFRTESFRLAALCAGAFALCFGAFIVFTYLNTTAALQDQLRGKISDDLNEFVSDATTDGTDTVVQNIRERLASNHVNVAYYFVADSSGRRLVGNLDTVELSSGLQKITVSPDNDSGNSNVDEDHEVWGQGQKVPDGSFIFVGQDTSKMLSIQESMINSFLWSASLATLMAVALGLFLSRRFLRRVDEINETSHAIIDGQLAKRIPLRGTHDEFDRLSANLNHLLDNNQNLLNSLREISTNIAHDLRSPLSRLLQRLEYAQQRAKTTKEFKRFNEESIVDAKQTLATFAALMRIAQVESGSSKSDFTRVNLSAVFERVASVYQAVAEDSGKSLETEITPNLHVRGDAELLLLLVVNLVENAIRHTPVGTKISLTLGRHENETVAWVADTGPGIPQDMRQKVIERFQRLDQSRSTPGNGLGLALAAAIAKLHDTKIDFGENNPGLKAQFKLAAI
jgi:signal transduction histidine kinase